MSIRSAPEVICHGITGGASTGLVFSSTDNSTGSQLARNLVAGANYTIPFETKGQQATLLMNYVKGTETNIQLSWLTFGANAVYTADRQWNLNQNQQSDTLTQTAPFITGTSYLLQQSSITAVPWQTAVFAASQVSAFPLHFGAAPGVASWLPGRYSRILLVVTGAPDAASIVHLEISWSGDV